MANTTYAMRGTRGVGVHSRHDEVSLKEKVSYIRGAFMRADLSTSNIEIKALKDMRCTCFERNCTVIAYNTVNLQRPEQTEWRLN